MLSLLPQWENTCSKVIFLNGKSLPPRPGVKVILNDYYFSFFVGFSSFYNCDHDIPDCDVTTITRFYITKMSNNHCPQPPFRNSYFTDNFCLLRGIPLLFNLFG